MAGRNRTLETRDASKRKTAWKPAALLPVPDKEEGYEYRWIRVGSRGSSDVQNVSKRMREGWTPVALEDHPELQTESDANSRFAGGVEIGGLLLCKNSKENVEARNEYYAQQAQTQMTAVDQNYLRENNPAMPLYEPERRTKVTFGEG